MLTACTTAALPSLLAYNQHFGSTPTSAVQRIVVATARLHSTLDKHSYGLPVYLCAWLTVCRSMQGVKVT